ncbi:MAG: efflux RND transporter periplasmic adaptor subunit [Bryobacteraceae bacterium]
MKRKWLWILPAIVVPLALAALTGSRLYQSATAPIDIVPVTPIKRGDVTFTIAARGELRGGNSEVLTAPMAGGQEMPINYLRSPGELVEKGDIIAEFDKTEQTFRLREAQADLAEAEQQVIQAQADSESKEEENRYALIKAKNDVKLAELEVQKNDILGAIAAKQNLLARESARDQLRQLERDLASRKATTDAAIRIQEAARSKAKMLADTAQRNINNLTLRAGSAGYVAIQQNMNGNFFMFGMQLPMLQVGDTVRSGMAVAQIPDMKNWELSAKISELDRGHLAVGQGSTIQVIALPGKKFAGKIKNMGGTSGPPWDRNFICQISLEDPAAELRPGMTANVVIVTETMRGVLWAPAQALFESDGRTFVYVKSSAGSFEPRDVKLVRRSESQVVITGLNEGQGVALASPDQQRKKGGGAGGAMKAISKS